jgi:Carboxypeptidase regulatory-like domain
VKRALIVGLLLMLAASAQASSVEVKALKPQASSRHVRVIVLLNGHPAIGASVNFCTVGDRPCLSTFTGKNGVAVSPRLPDGDYTVTASFKDVAGGDLSLHVSPKGKTRAFAIDLSEAFRSAQDYRAASDSLPSRATLQVFKGILRDPTGATVPGADIQIVRKGSADHSIVQRLKTDPAGHFSATLAVGIYVAFFSAPGFRTEIVPYEIAAEGSNELEVKLQVGQTSESMKVAVKKINAQTH